MVQVEVSIHTILYVRSIYPAGLFRRVKKYDAPVYQSQHPELNKYISGAVKAVGDEIIRVKCFNVPQPQLTRSSVGNSRACCDCHS